MTVTNATPWWGTLVVAVVGFVGIVVAQWSSTHRDRMRAKAERQERAHARMADLYADFIDVALHYARVTAGPVAPDDEDVKQNRARLTHLVARISLTAPAPVHRAATKVLQQMLELRYVTEAHGRKSAEAESAATVYREVAEAALRAMRTDLGGRVARR